MSFTENWRNYASGAIALFVLLTGVILILINSAITLDTRYFDIYWTLAITVFIFSLGAIFMPKKSSSSSSELVKGSFFTFQESDWRFLSGGIIPFIVWGIVLVALMFAIAQRPQGFFTPLSPYTASIGFSVNDIVKHWFPTNLFLGAIVPGILEELAIFMGINILVMLFTGLLRLFPKTRRIASSIGFHILVTIVFCAVGALAFSLAHGRYSGNDNALGYAFGFEFTMQLLNQFTGGFFSWIPHIIHNSLVIASVGYSFVLFHAGVVGPGIANYLKTKWDNKGGTTT